MEYSEADLQQALLRFILNELRGCGCVGGIVKAVDEDQFTCDVQVGDNLHTGVPLRVIVGSQGSWTEIPVVGSNCLMIFRDARFNEPQILMFDQVDQLLINCQTVVKFNGGSLGGMVKLNDLVQHLNKIEQDINNLKQVFTGWVPVPEDGGSALKLAAATWAGQQIEPTQKTDLENTAIQQ